MTILGAPFLKGPAVNKVLLEKVEDLERVIQRLTLLQSHDALCLLRNALALPKLQYVLRTATCAGNNLLERFDNTLRQGLSSILNIQLSDDQWTQASSPVQMGGLVVRSAVMLAPSAYLASAAATLLLQNTLINDPSPTILDPCRGSSGLVESNGQARSSRSASK